MIEALIIGLFILLGSLFLIFLWEMWKRTRRLSEPWQQK